MKTSTTKLSTIGIGLIILNLAFTAVSDAQLTGRKFLEAAVAMWTFEEVGREGIPDITGNGHDAKLVNKPTLVDGKFGKAIEFSDDRKNYLEPVRTYAVEPSKPCSSAMQRELSMPDESGNSS